MFHPVPRVDRWDPIIGITVSLIIGALIAAVMVFGGKAGSQGPQPGLRQTSATR